MRGGVLVYIIPSEDPSVEGRLNIQPLPLALVRERITQACQLQTEGVDTQENVVIKAERPTKWLVEAIAYRGHYGDAVRPLVGITQSPTLRVDRTIIQSPGYDAEQSVSCTQDRPSGNQAFTNRPHNERLH